MRYVFDLFLLKYASLAFLAMVAVVGSRNAVAVEGSQVPAIKSAGTTGAISSTMPVSANQPVLLDLPQIADELKAESQAVNGLRRKVLFDDYQTRIILLDFDADGELPSHPAPGLATISVMKGSVEFRVLGKPYHLVAGQAVVILPESNHSLHATQKSQVLVTINKAATPAKLKPQKIER